MKEQLNRENKKNKLLNINFICTGNTCRSYMAEAIANHLLKTHYFKINTELKESLVVGSAGTAVMFEDIPLKSFRALELLKVPNLKFIPKQIDKVMVETSNLLITMASVHKKHIELGFDAIDQTKIFTLRELANICLYLRLENILNEEIFASSYPDPRKTRLEMKTFSTKKTLDRIFSLKASDRQRILNAKDIEINDPYGGSLKKYLETARTIKDNIGIFLDYILLS